MGGITSGLTRPISIVWGWMDWGIEDTLGWATTDISVGGIDSTYCFTG